MEKGTSANEKQNEKSSGSTTVKIKTETENVELKRELKLVSAVSFNISCMIGSGIFVSPTAAFSYSGSIGMCIIVWLTCGFVCLLNALVFAELGTVVPRSGSIYVYYTEAFNNLHPFWGPIPAFMYAMLNTLILPPAGIAIITMSLAEYVSEPFFCILQLKTEIFGYEKKCIAIMALGIITFINALSVKILIKTQNMFTITKIVVCLIIIFSGFYSFYTGHTNYLENIFKDTSDNPTMIILAFYNTFWAYDGWSAITSVTEEVKNPSKNIPRCILISVPFVTILYVFMNIAYMAELTKVEMETTPTVAVLYGKKILGDFNIIISIGVALSTFGCALSSQFRNTRLYYVASQEGHMIRVFSFLNINRMTPIPAVVFQGTISAIFVIFSDLYGLIIYSSLFLCIFYTLSIVALIILRKTKPNANRPYKVPIVIAYFALLINTIFAIYPIVSDFSLKHIFSLGFVACGIILYTLFVYYKFEFSNLDWFTCIVQKIFQAAPPSLPHTTAKESSK